MNTTKTRQQNLRHRRDLENCIFYFIKKIKTTDPTDLEILQRNLNELFLCTHEYILLSNNKAKSFDQLKEQK